MKHKRRLSVADFVEQFDRALANVIAGGHRGGRAAGTACAAGHLRRRQSRDIARHTQGIGERYRSSMGRHFPQVMRSPVEVKGLLDGQAKVEIEAIAVL